MFFKEIHPGFKIEDVQNEYKARLNREEPIGWLKTIDGFANDHGGVLFLGVEDKSYLLIGFEENEIDKEKLYFFNTINQHFPVLPSILVELMPYDIKGKERFIIKIIVQEAKNKPIILKYDDLPMIFMRRDGYTSAASAEEIYYMSLASHFPAFDKQSTSYEYRREDFTKLFSFYSERHNGSLPEDKALASMGFYNEKNRLARGAYLFSDKYMDNNTRVVCSSYRGITRGEDSLISSRSFTGNLIDCYYFINEFISQRNSRGFIKTNNSRIDVDAFPLRAVFEAIINSLAHRDYLLDGSQISVDIFRNRLSISSPGSLYIGGELQVIYDLSSFISRRRNELISSIFVYCKAMEARGTGFEKIQDAYNSVDEDHKPFIFSKNNQFTIVLPDLTDEEGALSNQENIILKKNILNQSKYDMKILLYCYDQPRSIKEIATYLGITVSTYFKNKHLGNLVKQRFLNLGQEENKSVYSSNKDLVTLK